MASIQEASRLPKKIYSNSSRSANKENSGHSGTSALAAPLRPMKESQQLFNNVVNVGQLSGDGGFVWARDYGPLATTKWFLLEKLVVTHLLILSHFGAL